MRTLLVDGDMVLWSATFKAEQEAFARSRAIRQTNELVERLKAARAIVCFSDPSRRYFRHDLFSGYKPSSGERYPFYDEARDALSKVFICRTLPSLEADDVMGVLATCGALNGEVVMVSQDKDMLTVPGLHHNPRGGGSVIHEVMPHQADFQHMVQTLTGDGTDGYGGCPGVGVKGVGKILWGTPGDWWSQVVLAFKAKSLTESDALLQARLARICRSTEFDMKALRAVPWNPPGRAVAA